jgi:hypothetical protein
VTFSFTLQSITQHNVLFSLPFQLCALVNSLIANNYLIEVFMHDLTFLMSLLYILLNSTIHCQTQRKILKPAIVANCIKHSTNICEHFLSFFLLLPFLSQNVLIVLSELTFKLKKKWLQVCICVSFKFVTRHLFEEICDCKTLYLSLVKKHRMNIHAFFRISDYKNQHVRVFDSELRPADVKSTDRTFVCRFNCH